MNIAVHISFYYVESRLKYLQKILQNLSLISHNIKIFIYCNKEIELDSNFENIEIEIVQIKFLHENEKQKSIYSYLPFISRQSINPFYLTWKNRPYVEKYIEQYDVQIYLEDDIGFTNEALKYWLEHKDICIDNDYNLGFLRVEEDEASGSWFCTDLTKSPGRIVKIENQLFLLNDNNPYCGFWIYDKKELKKFAGSREWRFKFKDYGIREKSAIGWHGKNMKRYKGTIIPLRSTENNTYVVNDDCKVHHFPNNYIGDNEFCCIKFPVQLTIKPENIEQVAF